MKFCPKCGKPLEDDHISFCANCGFRFDVPAPQETQVSQPTPYPQATQASTINTAPQKSKPKNKLLLFAIGFFAVLLITTGVLFATGVLPDLFSSDSDEEAYQEEDSRDDKNVKNKDDEVNQNAATGSGGLEAMVADFGAIINSLGLSGDSLFGNQESGTVSSPAVEGFYPDYSMGGDVTLWTTDSTLEASINNYAKTALPNINFNVSVMPYEEYMNRIMLVLASGDTSVDIFTVDPPKGKSLIEGGALLDLTGLEMNEPQADLMDYALEYGTDSYGVVRAYPYQVAPGAMYYRRSLASKYLGTDDPAAIQDMISDPYEIETVAGQLYKSSNGTCKFTNFGGMDIPSKSLRYSPWVVNGKLNVDDQLVEFMNLCKSMNDNGYFSSCRQWDTAWFDSMSGSITDANGQTEDVFAYFLPKWGLDYLLKSYATNSTTNASTQGDWAMIKGPFSYSYGESYLCVNGNTQNPEAAKTVIHYLTMDTSFLESRARENNILSPSNVVNSTLAMDGNDAFLVDQNPINILMDISYSIDGTIFSPYDEQLDKLWDDQAEAYISGQISLEDAINNFKNNASQADPSIDISGSSMEGSL